MGPVRQRAPGAGTSAGAADWALVPNEAHRRGKADAPLSLVGASRRTPRRHQVVGLIGVRTHTSKNVLRFWPETSSKTASKSSVEAVESS
jgi:hypothetical protein